MNLLQLFFILTWVIISIIAFDVAKKQKFNALHFVVFIWVWLWLLVFTFFPWVLNIIWEFFWLPRWSDLLVYASIIFLIYFVLLLLSKVEQNNEDITKLVKEITFLEEKINKINENK